MTHRDFWKFAAFAHASEAILFILRDGELITEHHIRPGSENELPELLNEVAEQFRQVSLPFVKRQKSGLVRIPEYADTADGRAVCIVMLLEEVHEVHTRVAACFTRCKSREDGETRLEECVRYANERGISCKL